MESMEKADYWREQSRLYRESGLTLNTWCTEQNIVFGQMKYWIRKLGLRQSRRTATAPTWIAVTPEIPQPSGLVVQIGSARIAIPPGFDATLLRQVVQALEQA